LALASELSADGITLSEYASGIVDKIGAHVSAQISLRFTDLAEIPRIMNRLRSDPPAGVGAIDVRTIDDFEQGVDGFAPSDILRIWTADGSRIVVRPSGTEPKLKVYIDSSSLSGTVAERSADALRRLATLEEGMRSLLEAS